MSVRHPKVLAWESSLKAVINDIDRELEDQYGHRFRLNPLRPRTGETCSPEYDGLFEVGAVFSAGFGSDKGPGYIVRIRLSTTASVPKETRAQIEERVIDLLRARLPETFPGRDLFVERDGSAIKLYGDLSLGDVSTA